MYDEPFADSSQIPTHLISLMAKEHVTVVLSGDAGDELFGGYNRHVQAPILWKIILFFPKGIRSLVSFSILSISPKLLNQFGNYLPKGLKVIFLGDKLHRFADRLKRIKDQDDLYYSLVSEWEDPSKLVLKSKEPKNILERKSEWPQNLSFQERMMFLDMATYLPDDILVKVDRASMATSLETRVPFLDHRVVELALRIPVDQKIVGTKGKEVLRKILYKYVPKKLIDRPKQGFGIPLGEWLRGPLREWAEDLISKERLSKEGFFEAEMVRERWNEHLSGKRNWEHSLWSVLMFQSWLESQ
jgi:asparagine synthase (glutamine-hydrolysing)